MDYGLTGLFMLLALWLYESYCKPFNKLKKSVNDGIASFASDPPNSEHQQGYLAALQMLKRENAL